MCMSKMPSLNKSPTNFAAMIENIIGIPSVMSPVASVTMTVKLNVILTIPPSMETAPIKAYLK